MRRIYVRLEQLTIAELARVAADERRAPADQAALYIERALSAPKREQPSRNGGDHAVSDR